MSRFIYSSDNKRYHTFSYASKKRYQQKVFKVGLNAGFTCPNRDGQCAWGGCDFCNAIGSGDFQGHTTQSLINQYQNGLSIQRRKWPQAQGIAYFQAFSNTYAPLSQLKQLYDPFIAREDVIALAIATRVDCLNEDIIQYLEQLSLQKDVYLELGLQSIHDSTALAMNRSHTYEDFITMMNRLRQSSLKVVVHILNGYPNETTEMMIETAQQVGALKPYGIKIHMLNVLSDSPLGQRYLKEPFSMLSFDDYVDLVILQLRHIPKDVVIFRLSADAKEATLLAPEWVRQKVALLNEIDKRMAKRNVMQGDLCLE
jgi:uncharacterized protein